MRLFTFQDPLPLPPIPPEPPAQGPVVVGPGGVDPNFLVPQIVEMLVIAVVAIACTIAAVKILGPLFAAWARRLEGRGGESSLRGEIDQLRQELGEMDSLRARVGELEERVDFTERLLARQGSEAQLPRGGSA